jgi:UDP-N-acetyl-D-galactosamine dehydrogenase
LDTEAVLEAAGTKWNFHDYRPGLVGGHCIPVDPFYLIYESEQNGFSPELIQKGREVNEYVPKHVGKMTIKALNESEKVLKNSRVLIIGLAYKPNVEDIRTSAIGGVIDTLEEYGVDVVGFDPHADDETMRAAFDIDIQEEFSAEGFDGIVIGTPHNEFYGLNFGDVAYDMAEEPVIVDVDGAFEDHAQTNGFTYRKL